MPVTFPQGAKKFGHAGLILIDRNTNRATYTDQNPRVHGATDVPAVVQRVNLGDVTFDKEGNLPLDQQAALLKKVAEVRYHRDGATDIVNSTYIKTPAYIDEGIRKAIDSRIRKSANGQTGNYTVTSNNCINYVITMMEKGGKGFKSIISEQNDWHTMMPDRKLPNKAMTQLQDEVGNS